MKSNEIVKMLAGKKLKVTPQRTAILEAIVNLNNHPTAESIIEYIRRSHPNISVATVYKVLDTLADNGLVRKVLSDGERMRYDAVMENHHHIHYSDSGEIKDFIDNDLNRLIEEYFSKKRIDGFSIEGFELHIKGRRKGVKA